MHTDSETTDISLLGFMPYMIVVSLEMSDEPKLLLSAKLSYPQFEALIYLINDSFFEIYIMRSIRYTNCAEVLQVSITPTAISVKTSVSHKC